ncbi:MAG: hypothetical protein AB7U05_02980 [Mangrovibacterium sp.]
MSQFFLSGLAFCLAFSIIFLIQPSVAKVAFAKNFKASPEKNFPGIPLLTLGGISMFIGITLAIALCTNNSGFNELHPLISAMVVLLFSGLVIDSGHGYRYLRQFAKFFAAGLLVIRGEDGPEAIFSSLAPWLDALIQFGFVLLFMFAYHAAVVYRKMPFLFAGLFNALIFVILFWPIQSAASYTLLSITLSGSVTGILTYSRYALHQKKPLPLIGHTGIFLIAIILATLWLQLMKLWIQ